MKKPPSVKPEYVTKAFPSARSFESWLSRNHTRAKGVWIRYFKKSAGTKTILYAEALDLALCYGWIDGQAKPYDDKSWLQKFTPRRARSGWSKRNTDHVKRLQKEGRLKPAGLAQIAAAKKDGRWKAAYDSPRNAKPPAEFLETLAKHRKAEAFFKTLNRANVYAIVYRLQTAKKPETRTRRLKLIIAMLKAGKKFH